MYETNMNFDVWTKKAKKKNQNLLKKILFERYVESVIHMIELDGKSSSY